MALALKQNGVLVIDFLTPTKSSIPLKPIIANNAELFCLKSKKIVNHAIVKRIEFSDADKNFYFEETVSLLKT